MSGARRANWEAKLDAVVDAHREQVGELLEDETNSRRREISLVLVRLMEAENKLRRLRWTVYGLVAVSALRVAWAVIYG